MISKRQKLSNIAIACGMVCPLVVLWVAGVLPLVAHSDNPWVVPSVSLILGLIGIGGLWAVIESIIQYEISQTHLSKQQGEE